MTALKYNKNQLHEKLKKNPISPEKWVGSICPEDAQTINERISAKSTPSKKTHQMHQFAE